MEQAKAVKSHEKSKIPGLYCKKCTFLGISDCIYRFTTLKFTIYLIYEIWNRREHINVDFLFAFICCLLTISGYFDVANLASATFYVGKIPEHE